MQTHREIIEEHAEKQGWDQRATFTRSTHWRHPDPEVGTFIDVFWTSAGKVSTATFLNPDRVMERFLPNTRRDYLNKRDTVISWLTAIGPRVGIVALILDDLNDLDDESEDDVVCANGCPQGTEGIHKFSCPLSIAAGKESHPCS